MVIENPENKTLEFANPGSLLVLVIVFIFYSLGFIDLLAHKSAVPDIFGLYSLPFFLFLLLYAAGLVVLGVLFFHPPSLERVKKTIVYIQERSWLGTAFFAAGLAGILIIFTDWDRWRGFPALRLMFLLLILIVTGIVLFSGWSSRKPKPWRRAAALVLAAALLLELGLQGLAWAGWLPGFVSRIDSPFVAYGRVYTTEGGFTNSTRNRNGLYYPESRFDQRSRRILLTGDSLVEALQIEPRDHFGVQLEKLIAGAPTGETGTEVFALGLPGYSPTIYLDVPLLPFTLEFFQPDEIIVFVDLARDLDDLANPGPDSAAYTVSADGEVQRDTSTTPNFHRLQHTVLHAYEPIQPVLTIRSHYLTTKVLGALVAGGSGPAAAAQGLGPDADGAAGGVNLAFFTPDGNPQSERGYAILLDLLDRFQWYAEGRGHTVRLVTIPAFTPEFFNRDQGAAWEPSKGAYDLFLPERKLIEFASDHDLPILPMGHYMQAQGLSVGEIRDMFFEEGTGHLTPAGHAFFASAIFDCFYAAQGSSPGESLCAGQ